MPGSRIQWGAACFALIGLGCGYHVTVGGGRLADGSRAVRIDVAENLSLDVSVGLWLTEALRREADRAGLQVCDDEQAARIAPRLLAVQAVPQAVAMAGAGRFQARDQEATVMLEITVRLRSGQQMHLQLSDRESFLSAPDLSGTEINRLLAVRRVIERLAHQAIERLSRRFD